MGSLDDVGNITFGSLIPATANGGTIGAWAAHDRFVWVNDSISASTMKMDLTTTILPNTPAYANDADTGAIVQAMTVFQGRLIIADNGDDVYVESTDYVASGTINSGLLALDLADPKTPVALDVEGGGLTATSTIAEAISVDRGSTFTTVATWDSQADTEAAITGVAASRQFELRTTLASNGSATPTLYRHTLKVEPGVNQGQYRIYRIRLYEAQVDNTMSSSGRTPSTDLLALEALQASRAVVDIQEGSDTYTGTVRDIDFTADARCASADDGSWNGVATVRIKQVTL